MIRRILPLAAAALVATSLIPAVASADTDIDSRVVVAPIDSGINPYHDRFQVGADTAVTPDILAEFGIDADHILHISRSYDDDAAAGVYDGVKTGEDYWFEGTNIIVRSADFGSRPFLPDDSGDTHGTGVSGSVQAANPEAIIYFHEGLGTANEEHAFAHPSVDIVTTSYGLPTAAPIGNIGGSYDGVVNQGKMHFGANPNDPSAGPLDSTGGPWWGFSISGFEEGTSNGKAVLSGSAPEFVADFTQDLPYCDTCTTGTQSVSGTSFATPSSAGMMSAALLDLRRQADHDGPIVTVDDTAFMVHGQDADLQLTNWDLRRALEEAAAVPTVDEYDPAEAVFDLGTYPNLPAGGYTLYGWGLLTTDPERDTVTGILDFIATGETTKSADTCSYMTQHFAAREAIWTANFLSDGFGESADSYIAC